MNFPTDGKPSCMLGASVEQDIENDIHVGGWQQVQQRRRHRNCTVRRSCIVRDTATATEAQHGTIPPHSKAQLRNARRSVSKRRRNLKMLTLLPALGPALRPGGPRAMSSNKSSGRSRTAANNRRMKHLVSMTSSDRRATLGDREIHDLGGFDFFPT